MPIQKNLSVSPYFDDYDSAYDYYRMLFKPSTAVQVRELNQLQAMLQHQVEEFGDHILQRGTLLDGCQFTFDTSIPFVKIKDTTVDGAAPSLGSYIGLFARGDNDNVVANITDAIEGFESQDPDLKTLYLDYINSGDSNETRTFAEGETLTVYNADLRLYDIDVVVSPQGFSNGDTVIIQSAIEVQNTSGGTDFANGGFSNTSVVGNIITNSSSNATLEIVDIDLSANTDAVTLRVKPQDSDLAGGQSSDWLFEQGATIQDTTTGAEAVLTGFVGTGARAKFATTPAGVIDSVSIIDGGDGYSILPTVSIHSTTASNTQVGNLVLAAENFIARLVVAQETGNDAINNPTVGVGFGFSVSDGSIYQNGHFLRVGGQSIVVDKYANTPSDVAVGFKTVETIIDSDIDPNLLDNAAGFLNENAPGADRLKLTPTLEVKNLTDVEADSTFFPVVKFSEGRPYSQSTSAEYNKIGEEMARRTYEESGNYVLDRFNITTRSTVSIANSDTTFTYLIDPGHAYINGYRVKTDRNFAKDAAKATNTRTATNTATDLSYGNYVRVDDFAGLHAFKIGQQVELHSAPENAISVGGGTVASPGSQIGTARVRSVLHESGIQGTSTAVYRLYLFDIQMNAGKNFKTTKAVFASNATGLDGVADVILDVEPSTGASIATLKQRNSNSLLFDIDRPIKTISNIRYEYRTFQEGLDAVIGGTISVSNNAASVWPYSGALSTTEEDTLIVLPEVDLISNTDLSGTLSSVSSTTINGTGTAFTAEVQVGDYILVDDGVNSATVYVKSVSSATSLEYGPTSAATSVGAGASFTPVLPQNVPVPIANRSDRSATVSGSTLTIDLGMGLTVVGTATVIFNQKKDGASVVSKPATRKAYVQIQANTHPEGTQGPWTVGVSDVFRLRAVYAGSNTSASDVTSEFYIDTNQTRNFYDLSYLYQKPTSSYVIGANDQLLVEYDVFVPSGEGLKTVNSYTFNDEVSLSDLDTDPNNAINLLELPEVYAKGEYYDLREVFDFRPATVATGTISTDPSTAPVNPAEVSEATRFSGSGLQFPVPESDIVYDVEYYVPREDTIALKSNGEFEFFIGGEPSRETPDLFELYKADVPPYPSLARNLSSAVEDILNTNVANESFASRRRERYTIVTEQLQRQVEGYTMEEISQLERRVAVLEYYATLSETEDEVKNKIIPSSVDSTIERFKFGFFVDNFADYSLTDLDSPEQNSTIYEFMLQPGARDFIVPLIVAPSSRKYMTSTKIRYPHDRRRLISQTFATVGPKEIIGDLGPQPEPDFKSQCQFISNRNTQSDVGGATVFEENIFKLTSNTLAAGTNIEIDFNVYGGRDRLVIYQSKNESGPWTEIANNTDHVPTNLTLAEKRELNNKNLTPVKSFGKNRWIIDGDWSYSNGPSGETNFWIKDVGKIKIQYNPSDGRYIKVRNYKGSPHHSYYICYPADSLEDPIYKGSGDPKPAPTTLTPAKPSTTQKAAPSCGPSSTMHALLILKGIRPDPCKKQKKPKKKPIQTTHPIREARKNPGPAKPVFSLDPGGSRRKAMQNPPTYSSKKSGKTRKDILFGMLGGTPPGKSGPNKLEKAVDKESKASAKKATTGSVTPKVGSITSRRHILTKLP